MKNELFTKLYEKIKFISDNNEIKEDWDWENSDEDPDVEKADKELKKNKIELPKTKHKEVELKSDEKEEELDETNPTPKVAKSPAPKKTGNNTMFGTVHTTEEEPKGPESIDIPKLGDGKFNYGGDIYKESVYESLMKGYRKQITEDMSVTVNTGTDPQGNPTKSININATDSDAEALAQLLSLAGIQGQEVGTEIEVVGEVVDENKPDWPTNTETSNDAFQYSGGLNKPKVTGQTTVPVIAGQTDRMGKTNSMYEDVELERSLFGLFKDYKGDDE